MQIKAAALHSLSPLLLADGGGARRYFRCYGRRQTTVWPTVRLMRSHTFSVNHDVEAATPYKRNSNCLEKRRSGLSGWVEWVGGGGRGIQHSLNLLLVPKSQFHSGSSIALTRSGWQREFVSPPPPRPPPPPSPPLPPPPSLPNLEITFSAAGAKALPYPFQRTLPSPLSLQPCQPGSLPRGNEPRPAYSAEIMSAD